MNCECKGVLHRQFLCLKGDRIQDVYKIINYMGLWLLIDTFSGHFMNRWRSQHWFSHLKDVNLQRLNNKITKFVVPTYD